MNSIFRWIAPAFVIGAGVVLCQGRATAADATPPAATQPSDPSATGSVTVTVLDADGKPVEGAEVGLAMPGHHHAQGGGKHHHKKGDEPAAENPAAAPAEHAAHSDLPKGRTDAQGTVTLAGIPDGSYVVHAHMKGEGAGKETVAIQPSQTATITIHLVKKEHKAPAAPPAAN